MTQKTIAGRTDVVAGVNGRKMPEPSLEPKMETAKRADSGNGNAHLEHLNALFAKKDPDKNVRMNAVCCIDSEHLLDVIVNSVFPDTALYAVGRYLRAAHSKNSPEMAAMAAEMTPHLSAGCVAVTEILENMVDNIEKERMLTGIAEGAANHGVRQFAADALAKMGNEGGILTLEALTAINPDLRARQKTDTHLDKDRLNGGRKPERSHAI